MEMRILESHSNMFIIHELNCTLYYQNTKGENFIQGVPGGRDKTSGECSLC